MKTPTFQEYQKKLLEDFRSYAANADVPTHKYTEQRRITLNLLAQAQRERQSELESKELNNG